MSQPLTSQAQDVEESERPKNQDNNSQQNKSPDLLETEHTKINRERQSAVGKRQPRFAVLELARSHHRRCPLASPSMRSPPRAARCFRHLDPPTSYQDLPVHNFLLPIQLLQSIDVMILREKFDTLFSEMESRDKEFREGLQIVVVFHGFHGYQQKKCGMTANRIATRHEISWWLVIGCRSQLLRTPDREIPEQLSSTRRLFPDQLVTIYEEEKEKRMEERENREFEAAPALLR
ncbi:hypothetical protein TIFTF001_038041 [Ficus carica]|uniref:Uncharacterized protein n=1 Tax=Ficus carica TaxID=3494 RepID=A0AA88E6G7_FICCA|nr:hypothetical protein TIFTF001_038041 [Ficus carica]